MKKRRTTSLIVLLVGLCLSWWGVSALTRSEKVLLSQTPTSSQLAIIAEVLPPTISSTTTPQYVPMPAQLIDP